MCSSVCRPCARPPADERGPRGFRSMPSLLLLLIFPQLNGTRPALATSVCQRRHAVTDPFAARPPFTLHARNGRIAGTTCKYFRVTIRAGDKRNKRNVVVLFKGRNCLLRGPHASSDDKHFVLAPNSRHTHTRTHKHKRAGLGRNIADGIRDARYELRTVRKRWSDKTTRKRRTTSWTDRRDPGERQSSSHEVFRAQI